MFRPKKYLLLCLVLVLCCVLVFGCGKKDSTKDPDPDPVELEPGIPLTENFDEATTDNFFTAGYKALPNDSETSLYYSTGGSSTTTFVDGYIRLENARFTIGQTVQESKTTASGVEPKGDLDLSKPYRISFKITEKEIVDTAKEKLQIYVDNNDTTAANSIHGSASRLYSEILTAHTVGQIVTIESDVGTDHSFIQIRIESGATVGIDDLVIEYQ